jgi:hypothetical protein
MGSVGTLSGEGMIEALKLGGELLKAIRELTVAVVANTKARDEAGKKAETLVEMIKGKLP